MSDQDESIQRTNELLEQLLKHEQDKSSAREEQMAKIRETVNFEIPKFEYKALEDARTGFKNPDLDVRMEEIKKETEQRHQEEVAFRDQLVRILDQQTAVLEEILEHLKR